MHAMRAPRPMGRPKLAPMPPDLSLPPMPTHGCKPFVAQREGVAAYDVPLREGSSGPLPAPGGAPNTWSPCLPHPPRCERRHKHRRARTQPPAQKCPAAADAGDSSAGGAEEGDAAARADDAVPSPRKGYLATFPSFSPRQGGQKPSLVGEIEAYIERELRAYGDGDPPPTPGTQARYHIFRNAMNMFKHRFQSYDGFLSAFLREVDSYIKANFAHNSELTKMQQALADEAVAREEALQEAERRHERAMRDFRHQMQQTKLENLLSVSMERLEEQVGELELRCKRLEWENKELIQRNAALTQRMTQERSEVESRRSTAHEASVRRMLPPDGARKLDSFVNSLGRCLMLSLRAVEERRREAESAQQPAAVNAALQRKLTELREHYAEALDKVRQLRKQRDDARQSLHTAEAAVRRLEAAAEESAGQAAARLTRENEILQQRLRNCEQELASERKEFQEVLLRAQRKMGRVRQLYDDSSGSIVGGLLAAELRALGRQGLYGMGSGSDVPRWQRSALADPIPFVLPSIEEAQRQVASFFVAKRQYEQRAAPLPADCMLLLWAKGDAPLPGEEPPAWLGALDPVQQARVVGLVHAAQRYEYESPELAMFLACMHGTLSTECWADAETAAECFGEALARASETRCSAVVAACRAVAETCAARSVTACASLVTSLCPDKATMGRQAPAPAEGLLGWGPPGEKAAQLLRMQHYDECRGFALRVEERLREHARQAQKRRRSVGADAGGRPARPWGQARPPRDELLSIHPSELVPLVRSVDPEHPREPLLVAARVAATAAAAAAPGAKRRKESHSPRRGSRSPAPDPLEAPPSPSPVPVAADEDAPVPLEPFIVALRTGYVWRRRTPQTRLEDLLPLAHPPEPAAQQSTWASGKLPSPAPDSAPAVASGFGT
eukprot:TRINITY_DN8308_c0_g1_i2.p1 TRINITY_DN8308_c0_g1~~TRINITY_DN8308_c0_g1_i2.p1  ORF type:complete len:931 (+),score=317.25 TRINITY_DN8308_c0_g1_i2:86-2794(+)